MTTTLIQWELVAETKEWVGPLNVTVDGTPVTNFDVTLTPIGQRPSGFVAADVDPEPPGTASGVLVGTGTAWPLLPGKVYIIYVKFSSVPEVPVVRAGRIKVI